MPRKLPHNINEIDDSIPKNKANPNKTNKGALLGFHKWSFETKPSDETNYFKWFLFKQTWHEPLLSLELYIYVETQFHQIITQRLNLHVVEAKNIKNRSLRMNH